MPFRRGAVTLTHRAWAVACGLAACVLGCSSASAPSGTSDGTLMTDAPSQPSASPAGAAGAAALAPVATDPGDEASPSVVPLAPPVEADAQGAPGRVDAGRADTGSPAAAPRDTTNGSGGPVGPAVGLLPDVRVMAQVWEANVVPPSPTPQTRTTFAYTPDVPRSVSKLRARCGCKCLICNDL